MNYVRYKMTFQKGLHFGKRNLEDSEYTFFADTFFSALCQEAVRFGKEYLDKLVSITKQGKLVFSDGFPYIEDTFYIPKPMLHINVEKNGDSTVKKAYKKLSYIPSDCLEQYLKGELDVISEKNKFKKLGKSSVKNIVAIRGEEEARPYRLGVFNFEKGCGIYFILGYEDEKDKMFVEEIMEALSFSGIGGKRTSGLGRFDFYSGKIEEKFVKRLGVSGDLYMTLSTSLPKEDELEEVLEDANYSMIKRSGFVNSYNYADEFLRKRDLYVLASGACVKSVFDGDVYDVSEGGKHSVYRYAKPLFLEVSL